MAADNKKFESRSRLLKEIEDRNLRIEKTTKNTAINQDLLNRYTEKQSKLQTKLIGELKEINKERIQGLAQAEQSMGSMGSMYSNLNSLEQTRINTALKLKDTNDKSSEAQRAAANEMASINQKIAGLTSTDIAQREELKGQYEAQEKILGSGENISQDIVDNLKNQNTQANGFADMSQKTKDILQSQHDVLDGIEKTILGTLSTIKTLYGNLQGAFGGVVSAAGVVVGKIGEVNSELGTSMFQADGVARKAGVLSLVFGDAAQTAKDLSAALGDTNKATFELQASVGLMATNMGISGSEATKLVSSFSMLNGNSTDVALDMSKTSQEFAKQNGIIPAQLMGDLANSAEEFALFGKDGGENILRAAGYAAKLGTNMATLSGIAEGLLDFESSVTKELELGVMLGKNINLNKARELAYSGDIEGATRETLKQLGGVEAFNKMDYYQKKQTADLLGVSVAELQKMNSKMENAGSLGSVISENFSVAGESINAGLNKYLGTSLKAMGGFITASAQVGANFKTMGISLGGIRKSMAGMVKGAYNYVKQLIMGNALTKAQKSLSDKQIGAGFGGKKAKDMLAAKLSKDAGSSISTKATSTVTDSVKVPDAPKGPSMGDKLKDLAGGLKAMGNAKVLFGALNLIPTAIGFVAIIAGLPGMLGVSLLGAGAGAGLIALAPGLTAMASTFAGIGAVALTGLAFATLLAGIPAMLLLAIAGPLAAGGISALVPALIALGTAMVSGVGALGLAALIAAGVGLGASLALIGAGAMMMGAGIMLAATGFSILLPALGTFMAGITLKQVALVGLFAYSLLGLGASLGILGLASMMALPSLLGLSGVMLLLGAGLNFVGMGLQMIGGGMGSVMTTLTQLTPLLMGIMGTIAPIGLLSLAFMGLAASLMFLGSAGIFALPTLIGIAAASAGIALVAEIFGFGGGSGESSEAGAIEGGTLSEYETSMLNKMDQLIQATSSQRDIYLDRDKVTNVVMDRGERSAVNKFKLNRA
jgi:hypothetical protein